MEYYIVPYKLLSISHGLLYINIHLVHKIIYINVYKPYIISYYNTDITL